MGIARTFGSKRRERWSAADSRGKRSGKSMEICMLRSDNGGNSLQDKLCCDWIDDGLREMLEEESEN